MPQTGEQFAQYTILSSLGVGGMGEVYLAEDTLLGRKAALKFLASDRSSHSDHLSRFLREARAASALNHPNICTIYEINDSGAAPFIAMEHIEGETLAAMIERRRRNVRQAVSIAIQVASALAEAHSIGIIHRDIKPANVIVNARGQAKLLDFGLAKRIEQSGELSNDQFATGAGMILGTASYMSPEQARGLEVGTASDVWSFGVCLYEMLTGKQPFTGETATDTLAAILTRDPEPPTQLFPNIPAELERIVLRCLRRSVDARYQDAVELLRDLEGFNIKLAGLSEAEISPDEKTHIFESAPTEVSERKVTGADLVDPHKRTNNLSRHYGSIIGREKEKAAVIELLSKESTRLVTLTGIGGTGKTRLAQAVGLEMLPEFSAGVFFIELAGVAQPDLVAASIAQPLGIKDTGGLPVLELLKDHLKDREMLLVLDNFEQVVDAGPQLAELLSECERLKILVTSRVLLHLSVEREMVVPPLSPPSGAVPFTELQANEAIRLFVERAVAVKPSFELTEENAAAIAAICLRLEGLPLAIELAAARIKILSPEGILTRLEDRLNFLTGGPRDLPARQRTMHGAVDWSYGLLTEDEKSLFRRLSVFAGGFRLDAAEALHGESSGDVVDLVTSLVNQSLLLDRRQRNGEPRFQMLDVVRDYAIASLDAAGEKESVMAEHAAYFVSLAEEAEPFLQAARSADWLDRLEEEDDNIRTAMQWSLNNEPRLAVRLAVGLRNFWLLHSHLGEGYRWLKAALESGGDHPAALRFKLMNGLGLAARFRGDLKTAHEAYENGLAAGIEARDNQGIAVSSRGLGLVAMEQGDLAASEIYFGSGLEISRELDDKFGTALSLSFLGDLARTQGDYAKARPLFEEALEYFKELDNKSAAADSLNNLAASEFSLGDFESARQHFGESMSIASTLGNKMTISYSIDGFAALAVAAGELPTAASLAAAADAVRDSIGYKIEPAEKRFRDNYLEKLITMLPAADLEAGTARGRTLTLNQAMSECGIN